MSRIPVVILSFFDFVVFVVRTDFFLTSEEMCDFFDKRGYPSVVQGGQHRAQQIDRQSALQTSQKENNDRIPFTLSPHISPSQPRSKIHHSKKL